MVMGVQGAQAPCTPLDRRTTASGTSIRCSFGSMTVNERVSSDRIGRSPESLQPVQERFQMAPCPWKRASVVPDSALHREAAEGHRGPPSVEYCRREATRAQESFVFFMLHSQT